MQAITSLDGQRGLPRYFPQAFAIAARMDNGRLDILLPDGRRFRVEGARPGPVAEITVHDADVFARLLREGDLGFSEAYLEGAWSTPDLQAFMDLIHNDNPALYDHWPGIGLLRAYERLRFWLQSNTKRQARRNIAHHYDLGNEFYARWLDESMTYSSGLFLTGQETLERAQEQKYAAMCDAIGAAPGQHVLEIGCGWGGFAAFAAAEVGARVTGITISRAQYEFASRRIQDMGLNDRVSIELRDYRDTVGQFDRVASIEMIEAVGEGYWPTYFQTIRDRLRSGGRAALQVITIDDRYYDGYRRSADYIQKYIFPGGMLPSMSALTQEVARAGMRITDGFGFRQDYARTLREWNQRFQAGWPHLRAMGFDDRFKRMWEQYFAYCAAGFEVGCIDVKQIAIARD